MVTVSDTSDRMEAVSFFWWVYLDGKLVAALFELKFHCIYVPVIIFLFLYFFEEGRLSLEI